MPKGLKAALEDIQAKAIDLSELRVQTVTGDVSAVIKSKNFDDLEKLLTPGTEANAVASLQLVLDTTIKFDGDSLNFISTAASPELIEIHKEAVAAGLKQRQGFIEMFKDIVAR
ncbi:MAG: hypothetical protein O2780_14535 [Proteobacteria bacterium]|jgi:hypothetical protein|nr:hypothetical protein [Pseudomonadota bacterium]MDA1298750.1 hypothetical protein [Pseudomonadota bacterium]